jgi:hypothetical protein
MSNEENIPAWWRVPRTKLPEDIRPGDVVQTPKGERTVKAIRQDDTFVVDYMPAPDSENRGPDKQVLGRDQAQTIVRLGERMPTNDELATAIEAIAQGKEFSTFVETAALEECVRRGWVEPTHRLTPAGKMVRAMLNEKEEPNGNEED